MSLLLLVDPSRPGKKGDVSSNNKNPTGKSLFINNYYLNLISR